MLLLSACKPDGFINKVKYDGEKYINTCETFSASMQKLIERNNTSGVLRVSQYDNSDFAYFYLEEGQFEVKGDTLYFRLVKDLDYPKLLDKGVAIHVMASYEAPGSLSGLDAPDQGDLGMLVVDRAYYLAKRKPFFMYRIPLNGVRVEGKQLKLSFALAQYDKNGQLKKYFCQTDEQPIGIARPACCTAQPWQSSGLQSVVAVPDIKVKPEQFVYESFTGTIDVQFNESSFNLGDDANFQASMIQLYVDKYKELDYRLSHLDLTGYASPGGREAFNLRLSQRRADALKTGLEILNGNLEGLEIKAVGKGEDWERVKLLTQVSSLSAEQKQQVLAIAGDETLTLDAREAKLRKLPFWQTLVDEVLVKARHTFAYMDFDYKGAIPTYKRYTERMSIISPELERTITTPIEARPYQEGDDIQQGIAHLDKILLETATPSLYAMRASYYLAQDKVDQAVADLEKASRFRDANASGYNLAIQGYRILYADTYELDEKKKLYQEFSDAAQKNPADRTLFFNRAILMDKLGITGKAITEYANLLEGYTPSAANYNNRGVARLKAHHVREAAADFEAAVAADSQLAEAYFNLAATYAYLGYSRKTQEYLDKAVALKPEYRALIFNSPIFSVLSETAAFDKYRNGGE
ncbi:MAG: hypothetical protein OHK0039_24240 [Bacteroidia bacterium]